MTTSILYEDLLLAIRFSTVCTILMVNFGEEIIDFPLHCGRYSATKIYTYL